MNELDLFDFPISQDFADYVRWKNDMPVAQRYPSKESYKGESRTGRPQKVKEVLSHRQPIQASDFYRSVKR